MSIKSEISHLEKNWPWAKGTYFDGGWFLYPVGGLTDEEANRVVKTHRSLVELTHLKNYDNIGEWVHFDGCCYRQETDLMGLHHGRNE